MKKMLAIFLTLVTFVSCDKNNEEFSTQTSVKGTLSLNTQATWENEPDAISRANADNTPITYTFEAWSHDAVPRCVLHATATGTLAGAAIEIALVPGNYDFLFWADYGREYYDTENLRQVKIATTSYTSPADDSRDAFAGVLTGITWKGGSGTGITLLRPLAKLQLQNNAPFATEHETVKAVYRNTPTRYDVLTGKTSEPQAIEVSFPKVNAGTTSAGMDFLFPISGQGTAIGLETTVDGVEKRLDVLPLHTNYITKVTAKFGE
ncbi:DUF6562 domain-containing protein [Butyricimonas synergistica]|uniref:DUF6562 domain-containing protein n=1 Tax=Butyricimonas synergistica TaxID=544644 RepID=UPI000366744A|nr:DUF6562 domain-containing protein [Butyricimonas synergistica]